MKTPDEIKKGLECCSAEECTWDNGCPYMGLFSECNEGLKHDALAYIQQLEAQNVELSGKIGQLEGVLQEAKQKVCDLIGKVDKHSGNLNSTIAEFNNRIRQLEAERDAAVACIPKVCEYCKNNVPLNKLGQTGCAIDSVFPDGCLNGNTRWEWRGVQKEE